MESLERKDLSTGTEEPIKSEGRVPSPDTSERSNSAASPPPNCSICLGKLINTSFTDSCLHQFCFTCLLQWSKIKTECPLCKQTFKSIIHNVRSEEDYDQYHVQYTSQVATTLDVTADIHISGHWDVAVGVVPVRPFMYRTTLGANRRYGLLLNPDAVARGEQIPSISPQISNEERRRRNLNPLGYRRTVYRHGVWAASLPDAFGRYRESSADHYRRHPAETNRLIPWLNRELQVLLNNDRPHIAYVLSVITDTITQYDIHSPEFRNVVRPYFGIHTDHFVHEFSNFARSNFDIIGYDQAVTYIPNRGLSNDYVTRAISPTLSTSSSSSSDSDVRVLNGHTALTHLIDMPGPSTVGQALGVPYNVIPDILTISSTSSSSENECEVIGYVKPRHERTPEIIDLSSSEVEEVNTSQSSANNTIPTEALLPAKEENQPSTSSPHNNSNNSSNSSNSRRTRRRTEDLVKAQMYEYLDTSSESDSASSDSDYNPGNNKKTRRHKNSTKKTSKTTSRKHLRTRARKKSTITQRKTRSHLSHSSCGSDNESPQREVSSNRGTKRYLSKSSDESNTEKPTKKTKKAKKSKSPRKLRKRAVTSSSASKAPSYNYSSSYSSSSSNSDNEDKNKTGSSSSRRRSKIFFSSEEPSEKSSSKSSSTRTRNQLLNGSNNVHSDMSELSYLSSRRSSSESYDSRKNLERLQNPDNEENSRHCSSDEEKRSSNGQRSSRSSSTYSDDTASALFAKLKSSVISITTSTTVQTSSQSHQEFSSTSASVSSLKSDASTPTEHSVSPKNSRGSSVFSDEASSSCPKSKSSFTSTTTKTNGQSASQCNSTTALAPLGSKSDASSPAEHSVSSKATGSRHRSHKKRKESKKRRRSRS